MDLFLLEWNCYITGYEHTQFQKKMPVFPSVFCNLYTYQQCKNSRCSTTHPLLLIVYFPFYQPGGRVVCALRFNEQLPDD